MIKTKNRKIIIFNTRNIKINTIDMRINRVKYTVITAMITSIIDNKVNFIRILSKDLL